MAGNFASNTAVSVAASKAEIECIVERYGAGQFMSAWSADQAIIAFVMEGRQVRFTLTMPGKSEKRFTHHSRGARTPDAALKEWEQAYRQRWRALALVIKAKQRIAVFEDEILANIAAPNGKALGGGTRPLPTSGEMTMRLPDRRSSKCSKESSYPLSCSSRRAKTCPRSSSSASQTTA